MINTQAKDYSHRKQWIIDRLTQLSTLFAINVCVYAVRRYLEQEVSLAEQDAAKLIIDTWRKCQLVYEGDE